MRIEYDADIDLAGNVMAIHFIDTSDPQVIATLTAINGNPAKQVQAGYAITSKHPNAFKQETRWGMIVRHANDPLADPAIKVLALK